MLPLYRHYGIFISALGQLEKKYKYLGKDISSLATFFAAKSFWFYWPQYGCKVCSCFCWFIAVLWFLGRCYSYNPSKQAMFRITLHILGNVRMHLMRILKMVVSINIICLQELLATVFCKLYICNRNNFFNAFHDNEGRLMLLIMYLWYLTFYCNDIILISGKNVRVWKEQGQQLDFIWHHREASRNIG